MFFILVDFEFIGPNVWVFTLTIVSSSKFPSAAEQHVYEQL